MGETSSREALIDRVADLGEVDRWECRFDTPHDILSKSNLDTLLSHHPDSSLRPIALTSAHLTRRFAGLAGSLDARVFVRLCLDVRAYLIDELDERLREGAAAGKLSFDVARLVPDEARRPEGSARVHDGELLAEAQDDLCETVEDDLRLGQRDRVPASAAPRVAHSAVPLIVGAAIGAGLAMMLHGAAARQSTPAPPFEAA